MIDQPNSNEEIATKEGIKTGIEDHLTERFKSSRPIVLGTICENYFKKYTNYSKRQKIVFIQQVAQKASNKDSHIVKLIQYIGLEKAGIVECECADRDLTEDWIEQKETLTKEQIQIALIISALSPSLVKYRQKLWEEYQKIIYDQELDINIELSVAISSAIQKQNPEGTSNVLTELNNLRNNYSTAKRIDPKLPTRRNQKNKINTYLTSILNMCITKFGEKHIDVKRIDNISDNQRLLISKCLKINDDLFKRFRYDGKNDTEKESKVINAFRREHNIRTIFISYPKTGRTWLRSVMKDIIESKKNIIPFVKISEPIFTHLMSNPAFWSVKSEDFIAPKYETDVVVFMHRDPRDTIVSQFHQVHKRDLPHMKEKWSEYDYILTDTVLAEEYPPKDINEFVLNEHWGIKRVFNFNKNVLKSCNINHTWNYEQMSVDPYSTIKELCSKLGMTARFNTILQSIGNNSFEASLEREIGSNAKGRVGRLYKEHDLGDENARKIRKGICGGWQAEIGHEIHDELNRITKEYYDEISSHNSEILIPNEFV